MLTYTQTHTYTHLKWQKHLKSQSGEERNIMLIKRRFEWLLHYYQSRFYTKAYFPGESHLITTKESFVRGAW